MPLITSFSKIPIFSWIYHYRINPYNYYVVQIECSFNLTHSRLVFFRHLDIYSTIFQQFLNVISPIKATTIRKINLYCRKICCPRQRVYLMQLLTTPAEPDSSGVQRKSCCLVVTVCLLSQYMPTIEVDCTGLCLYSVIWRRQVRCEKRG